MTATQEIGIYSHKPLLIRDCHLELIGVYFLSMFYKANKNMMERKDLSDSEKMLVMVLQGLSERQGYCFATNAKLATMVGWGIDKLRNNLRTLSEKGIIEHELEDGNRRKLTLPQGGVQFHTGGGVQNDTGGCEDLHRGVCDSTQGGVQKCTPLHNRTINRTDNRTIKRDKRVNADDLEADFYKVEEVESLSQTHEYQKEKVPPKRKRFEPPTEAEAQLFFQATDNPQAWEGYFNYYLANGWRVGKNPMKDWQAAARSWVSREKTYSKSTPNHNGNRTNARSIATNIAVEIANGDWDITKG